MKNTDRHQQHRQRAQTEERTVQANQSTELNEYLTSEEVIHPQPVAVFPADIFSFYS